MNCPMTTFYTETEPVFPHQTGESVKALPRPALPVIDDECKPLDWRDHLFIGVTAIGITALAILAARAIVLYAPRWF